MAAAIVAATKESVFPMPFRGLQAETACLFGSAKRDLDDISFHDTSFRLFIENRKEGQSELKFTFLRLSKPIRTYNNDVHIVALDFSHEPVSRRQVCRCCHADKRRHLIRSTGVKRPCLFIVGIHFPPRCHRPNEGAAKKNTSSTMHTAKKISPKRALNLDDHIKFCINIYCTT